MVSFSYMSQVIFWPHMIFTAVEFDESFMLVYKVVWRPKSGVRAVNITTRKMPSPHNNLARYAASLIKLQSSYSS